MVITTAKHAFRWKFWIFGWANGDYDAIYNYEPFFNFGFKPARLWIRMTWKRGPGE